MQGGFCVEESDTAGATGAVWNSIGLFLKQEGSSHMQSHSMSTPDTEQGGEKPMCTPGKRSLMLLVVLALVSFALVGML